ncbi:MAG: peptide/nickel transport system permease protein [Solirubrobacteraceae bacterium]|nr:peptide/nickel transport system permease protein [Solirubrobacteraceae bacterium]
MRGHLLRRAGASLIVLLVASVVVFAGVRALPGDPALALAGEDRSARALTAIRAKYGLDQPVPVQYVRWLGHVVRGDFGSSTRTGLGVGSTILDRLPVTLELAFLSLLVAVGLGVSLGVLAAVRRGSVADYAGSTAALVGLSVPHFWLGLMLILLFAIGLGVLPASGFVPLFADPIDNLRHMLLPAVVLGTGFSAVIFRQTRAAMLESLSTDYVRTARAKGLAERQVVGSHALRNSLLTVVTLIGLQLGQLISGAVVTEQVFVLPGFGKLTLDAVFQRDYPVIEGVVLLTTVGYVVINFVVDLLYSVLNPRIRVAEDAT